MNRSALTEWKIVDPWQAWIEDWLAQQLQDAKSGKLGPAPLREGVAVVNLLTEALGYELASVGRREVMRLARVLKDMGMRRRRIMHAGERNWMWAWPHGARGGLVWPRWRTAAKPKKQGDRDLRLP